MCGVSVCERERRLHTFSRRLGRELHLTRGSGPAGTRGFSFQMTPTLGTRAELALVACARPPLVTTDLALTTRPAARTRA